MKRILLALAIFALVLPATRPAEAGVDVSVDFFYNNLNTGGSWVDAGDYGYAWQPSIAVSNRDWRPYTDGYWAYTDVGWTWVSNEDFGWATYHYGRWARVRGQGWIWVPGRDWGPAWVSWRTGGDHVGWAPLPPRRGYDGSGEVVYEGRPIDGYVDIDYDIGPAYYNFVDIRYIGGFGLRSRILPIEQNVTYIDNSVNVTNITYNNSTVYNYGPDYNRMSAYSTQPIQRLKIQRDANVDINAAAQSGALTKVQGDTLMVAAPQQLKAAEKSAAPKEVKTKIAKDQLETGWSGVSDEKTKTDMQAKMKKEDRKSIPEPKIQPQNPAALTAPSPGAPATASAAPIASVAPGKENENGRGKPTKDQLPLGKSSPAPSVAPGASTPAPDKMAPKPDMKKDRGQLKAAPTPMGIATPAQAEAGPDGDKGKNDRKGSDKKVDAVKPVSTPQVPAITPPTKMTEPSDAMPPAGRGGNQKPAKLPDMKTSERPIKEAPPIKQPEMQKAPERLSTPPPAPSGNGDNGLGRGNRKADRLNVPQAPPQAPDAPPPQREQPVMRKERPMPPPQPQMAPPQRAPEKVAPPQGGRPEKPKKEKKGDEPAPTPEG